MKIVHYIEKLSEWSGSFSAWVIIPLMCVVVYEVFMRHFLNAPTGWGYDTCWMLYSLQFMIGGAYTLLKKGHIRIDIVYGVLTERQQLWFDTFIYIFILLFPFVLLSWAGIEFAADAWSSGENLSTTNWPFPAGPSKTVIPVAFILLGLQAVAEVTKNIKKLTKGGAK